MNKLTIFIIACILLLKQSAVAQFSTVSPIMPLPVSTDTKDKPQSKLWQHDGKYWGVFTNQAGTHVWRLDGNSWTKILTISSSVNARADCKVSGNLVHILLFRKSTSYLVTVEYNPKNGTYELWSELSARVPLNLHPAAETATIDIDSEGRMWLVSDTYSTITVSWSDFPYVNWSLPIEIASGVSLDDIGAVIAFPMFKKIGVFWSDQNTKRFGFKMHTDGDDPAAWSNNELPSSQTAIDLNGGMADDHMNMTLSSNGTLYCAVKTSYDQIGYPRLALLVRRPSGTWDNLYEVSQAGTRGIALLNEEFGKLRIVYSSSEDGGDILYRESATEKIAFGPPQVLIKGQYLNHSTTMKANNGRNAIIVASDTAAVVGVLVSDKIEPTLAASPNPFHASSTIYFTSPVTGSYAVHVYNMTGRRVNTIRSGYARAGEKLVADLNADQLPAGIYILRLEIEGHNRTLKIIRN